MNVQNNNDPLEGLYEDEQDDSVLKSIADPLAGLYEEEGQAPASPQMDEFTRVQNLRKSRGYEEPSPQPPKQMEAWEAFAEPGTTGHPEDAKNAFESIPRAVAQVGRGVASGTTFGATENVPALETTGEPLEMIGEAIGGFAPINLIANGFGRAGVFLASKSPYLVGPLTTASEILSMTATGATVSALEDVAKGELPNADDMVNHGLEWGFLDLALKTLIKSGRTVAGLFGNAKKGSAYWDKVNETITQARNAGVDIQKPEEFAGYIERKLERSETTAPATEAKAQSILTKPPAKSNKQLPKHEPGPKSEKTEIAEKELIKNKATSDEDLQYRKLEPKRFDKINASSENIAEAYLPQEFTFEKEVKALEDNHLENRINQVAKRAETEQAFGENIQKHIEAQRQISKKDYKPFYDVAEESAQNILHNPQKTSNELFEAIKRIEAEGMKVAPEGYEKLHKTLLKAVEDIGYRVERSVDGSIKELIQIKDIPVSKSMELGRRFNKIADFDHVDFEVSDLIKGINKVQKAEIRASLEADKFAQESFDYAEKAYGVHAEKFSNENIRKLRGLGNTEKIAKLIDSPTVLDNLKSILTPNQYRHVERELLEKMKGLNEEKARSFYREYKGKLSKPNQKLAQDILASKKTNPKVNKTVPEEIREAIFKDLAKAVETGERPAKTLNLWKTERGQKVIEDALRNSPNKAEMLKYLEKQSLNDMFKEIITPSGHVDFNRLNKMLNDPATVKNIRLISGREGLEFLQDLEGLKGQLEKNLRILDQLPMRGENLVKGGKQIRNVESGQGKAKLRRRAEKNKTPKEAVRLAKEKLPFKGELKNETKGAPPIFKAKKGEYHKGDSLLRRMAYKQYPLETRYNALIEQVPLVGKIALSALGYATFGFAPIAQIHAAKFFFERLMFNKKLQRAFKNAAKPSTNPTIITERLLDFVNEFEEEET